MNRQRGSVRRDDRGFLSIWLLGLCLLLLVLGGVSLDLWRVFGDVAKLLVENSLERIGEVILNLWTASGEVPSLLVDNLFRGNGAVILDHWSLQD